MHLAMFFSLLVLLIQALSVTAATIGWVSYPIRPGEMVQVAGGGFTRHSSVVVKNLRDGTSAIVKPVDIDSAALKFRLPSSKDKYVAYNISIDGSASAAVNLPDIWWWQGDEGKSSTPGGWLRVFGRSIGVPQETPYFDEAISSAMSARNFVEARRLLQQAENEFATNSLQGTRLRLTPVDTSEANSVILHAQEINTTEWHALFQIPRTLLPGTYIGELSSGLAGEVWTRLEMFVSPQEPALSVISVLAPVQWKSDVFTVDCAWAKPVFERPCGWVGVRSQKEIDAALNAADANGGGIVLLPRGQYYIDGPIIVPDGVRLRGEAEELVSVYFREDNKDTAPSPGYIVSSGITDHRWAVEDITIYITAFYHSVFFVGPTCTSFTLQRVRVRAVAYAFSSTPCPGQLPGRGERATDFTVDDLGEVVYLAGNDNYKILDCDLLGTNIIIHTGRNPGTQASATNGIIARNEFWNGNAAHYFDDIKQVIFEHNTIRPGGTGPTGGNNIDNYGAKYCQHVYHAFNDFKHVWFGDREVMTFDPVWPGYYNGPVSVDRSGTLLRLVGGTGSADIESLGGAVYVLAGSGMGQYRRVIALPDKSYVKIDRPFATPLDNTSVVQLGAFKGKILFHANTYADSGGFQTYGFASDVIVSATHYERVEGLLSWGRSSGGATYAPNMRIQFLDNTFIEGNHLWNYNGSYPYPHPKTVEPYSIGVLGSDQDAQFCKPYPHMPKDCTTTPPQSFQGAINHLVMIRRNVMKSNGGIVVRGHSTNVIVEGNVVQKSYVDVHVNGTHTSHVFVDASSSGSEQFV